jgi:selenocysteine lyase/cysteine desulfurase
MKSSRREFIQNLAFIGIACTQKQLPILQVSHEVDWAAIKNNFLGAEHTVMNLNSGSAGMMSKSILDAHIKYMIEVNTFAPYEVLNRWQKDIKNNLQRLSNHINASQGHLYLLRNSTEGINIVLRGKQWEANDEIIYASCDYPSLENTLHQLRSEYNVTLNQIDHGTLKHLSDDEIISNYEKKITKNTKLLIITYMTHREGHILPVKRLCDMAHNYDVEVLIDGAHAIGQLNHSIDELECDYYVSSLHKWLNAPLGSGILYVKDEKIEHLKPSLSYPLSKQKSADKIEHLGTRAFHNAMTLGIALDELEEIGIDRKRERLHQLNRLWIDKVSANKNIEIITDTNRSGAIATVKVPMSVKQAQKSLLSDHKIHVKKTGYPERGYLRISSNLFLVESDVEKFAQALLKICK